MEVVMIELVLWAGLIFFLWVLKDSLSKLESDIEQSDGARKAPPSGNGHKLARAATQILAEPIGSYDGAPIFRYAIIDGKTYCFDHVCLCNAGAALAPDQRCLEPGLLYVACKGK
jgi:hypothetical protein